VHLLAETDYSNTTRGGNETQYMQPPIQVANSYPSNFAVIPAGICEVRGCFEIELHRPVKGKPAFTNIPAVLYLGRN
jgi:hypothetical protein